MIEPPRRSWWKGKRWWLAVALWLALGYPLSLGPVAYLEARWGLPQGFWLPYVPLVAAMEELPDVRDATILPYLQWWHDLARRDAT